MEDSYFSRNISLIKYFLQSRGCLHLIATTLSYKKGKKVKKKAKQELISHANYILRSSYMSKHFLDDGVILQFDIR